MDFTERNRVNIKARWKKVHESERKNIKFNPKYLSRLCGFLAGDGCLVKTRNSIRFFPDDESLIGPYLEAMKSVYGKEASIKQLKNHFEISITSKVIFEDLMKYCEFSTKKWNVPFSLLKTEENIIEWLKAFFDAEAHVNLHSK